MLLQHHALAPGVPTSPHQRQGSLQLASPDAPGGQPGLSPHEIHKQFHHESNDTERRNINEGFAE